MHLNVSRTPLSRHVVVAIVSVLLTLLSAPLFGQQDFEQAQIEAARATDKRFLAFIKLFQDTIVKVWGEEAKIGRLDASESRVLANIHVGDELHGVELTPRHFKDDQRFQLTEAEGTKENLLDLSVLDETRLQALIEATHSVAGGSTAHLFKIEMGYFPGSISRFIALVQMIGIGAQLSCAYDLATGERFDLDAAVGQPVAAPAAAPVRRPRGGLREWLAAWQEAVDGLEAAAGSPLKALGLRFSSIGITAILVDEGVSTTYTFDNNGLRKTGEPTADEESDEDKIQAWIESVPPPCPKPFDPRSVRLDRLGELADLALAKSALPYQGLVGARVERGSDCAAPEIIFVTRGPSSTAEVVFDQEGDPIASNHQ